MRDGGLDASRKSTHVYIEDAPGRRVTRGIVATTPTGWAGPWNATRREACESRSKQATRRRGVSTCCGSSGRRSTWCTAHGEAHRGIEDEDGSDRCAAPRASVADRRAARAGARAQSPEPRAAETPGGAAAGGTQADSAGERGTGPGAAATDRMAATGVGRRTCNSSLATAQVRNQLSGVPGGQPPAPRVELSPTASPRRTGHPRAILALPYPREPGPSGQLIVERLHWKAIQRYNAW